MRTLFIWLTLASSAIAQHPHFPEHVPDFADDPKAVYVRNGETLEVDGLKCVSTLVVEHGGTLILWPGANLVFLDQPFHENDNQEIGNGLIVMGDVLCMGSPKTPFVRSTSGIPAGATSATFDVPPQGWRPGDRIAIPDTRQRVNPSDYDSHTEIVVITDICGGTVEFTPTQYDHPVGTHEWMTPHVANISRDVLIQSENPDGIRGHTMTMGGIGEWGYAEIRDMGRTDAMRAIGDGNTNGRYPWHLHLMGDAGSSQHAEGLSVVGSRKWCYTIHGTNNATVTDCIGIGAVGATFMLENGLERGNTYERCIAIGARDGFSTRTQIPIETPVGQDTGRDGSGFWSRHTGNDIIDCIAADTQLHGFVFNGVSSPDILRENRATDAGIFRGNEAYSTGDMLWCREHSAGTNNADQSRFPRLTIDDCRGWSLYRSGTHIYRTAAVTVKDSEFYSDPLVASLNQGQEYFGEATLLRETSVGFRHEAAYPVSAVVIRDSVASGFNVGVQLPGTQNKDLMGFHEPGFLMERVTLGAAVQVFAPVVRHDAPYVLSDITFVDTGVLAAPTTPEGARIWLSLEGRSAWARPALHDIRINGEKYYYADETGEGREEREGVVGLVEQID